MQLQPLFCAALLAVSAGAQTTWIVNAGGGPGVNFTDLPSAVAAAADGDTIIVQTGPFNEGATPFTTNKGLTIVGEGGLVPIGTSAGAPIEVIGLPATSSFRMVGFSRPSNGALHFRIENCLGPVHLERLRCREFGFFFPTTPSMEIINSASVTVRDIVNFGTPAMQIDSSTVSLVQCRLGVTEINIGGGPWIGASDSSIDIVEPQFDTGFVIAAGITTDNCQLTIGGSSASTMSNPGGDLVDATGGTIVFDPAVSLSASGSLFVGTATVTSADVPATWADNANPGQSIAITSSAPVGAFNFLALGAPGLLTATPIGTLGIDAAQPFVIAGPTVVPASGSVSTALTIPASFALGSAFASQSVVLTPGQLQLSHPVTFVVH